MSPRLSFASVARLPAPHDNVAIATRRLEAGTTVALDGGDCTLSHTVLEGHRFAVRPIAPGESLLSWGHAFGTAVTPIAPGDYVCNRSVLDALAVRQIDGVSLPPQANFGDNLTPFRVDEKIFRPASASVPRPPSSNLTFLGHRRPGSRGVGTRNVIVILGTSSRTASFARQLADRLQPLARVHPGIDGIAAIAHTEGGGPAEPNNTLEVLRALAGFIVHPNVAAVLAVDYGVEPVSNARLRDFMREHRYPLEHVPHRFLTLDRGLAAGLAEGERIVRQWLPAAQAHPRTSEPLGGLRIALQCGGSDAFSGVSGNPLAGAVVHELIRHGGTGVLTETDEAFGAEGYLVENVRDLATARAFLARIDSFRERLGWHGLTAESNPSGGNKFRGLYNIALKSLGAVHKKDPRTRLDHVIDYAEPLGAPGFYFMNGPGNDLEGIAGQVAAGCNVILFVTGNGSVTNFPFVPTLKITTTTRRHQLLLHEMDINAGRYLDGESMESLAAESFALTVATASGQKTKGERAGHSQVSLWRNWRQTDSSQLAALRAREKPSGLPLETPNSRLQAPDSAVPPRAPAPTQNPEIKTPNPPPQRAATDRIALVLPTSLCSSQIARLAADRLNASRLGGTAGVTRFVALPHTEGCGFGGGSMQELLYRTYRGYLTHPNVVTALLLEHGCEKVPNDLMRHQLQLAGVAPERFGWASVQLDGGIEKVLGKIETWFAAKLAALPPLPATTPDAPPAPTTVAQPQAPNSPSSAAQNPEIKAQNGAPLHAGLNVALVTSAAVTSSTASALASLTRDTLAGGGSILIPESDPLLANEAFLAATLGATPPHATLAYGEPVARPGFHVVATETDHWTENLTGLGACGAHLAVAIVDRHARQGHPFVPVLQFAERAQRGALPADDIDAFLADDASADHAAITALVAAVVSQKHTPAAVAQGAVDFQLTRGLLGVST